MPSHPAWERASLRKRRLPVRVISVVRRFTDGRMDRGDRDRDSRFGSSVVDLYAGTPRDHWTPSLRFGTSERYFGWQAKSHTNNCKSSFFSSSFSYSTTAYSPAVSGFSGQTL